MVQTLETGYRTTTTSKIASTDTQIFVKTSPAITKGRVYLSNSGQEERVSFDTVTLVGSVYRLNNCVRGLSRSADPATAGTGLTWIAGTVIKIVLMHDQPLDKQNDQTMTGKLDFGANQGRLEFPNYTTAQRDAILTWQAGEVITNTTTGTNQQYLGGGWSDFGNTGTPNGSTTVAGKYQTATPAQIGAQTATGSTGAELAITTVNTAKTSSGASDENKIPVLDATGKLVLGFLPAMPETIFGNSADGVQGDANLTITGSNNTFIEKNFSSWTAGSTARTCTVTPTNCVVWIKIAGNADFTNWTFNFAGVGGPGGAQQTSGIGNIGIIGNNNNFTSTTPGNGGALGATNATGGTGGAKSSPSLNTNLFYLDAFCGAGGGSGGSNPNGGGFGGFGGAGGIGGGGLIITVGGNIVFSSTSATVAGSNGTGGTNGTGGASGGGGGGGGGAGTFVCLYRGTLTGSLTPTVTGGNGGAGGTGAGTTAGAGGGGGGALFNAGSNGANTSSASTGGTGGTGGAGVYLIKKI